jgi:hypothetical protein
MSPLRPLFLMACLLLAGCEPGASGPPSADGTPSEEGTKSTSQAGDAKVEGKTGTATEPPLGPADVVLRPAGPNSVEVWVEDKEAGELSMNPEGGMSGTAIIRLTGIARRYTVREVRVLCPPGVNRELALAVQRIFFAAGCTQAKVVDEGG